MVLSELHSIQQEYYDSRFQVLHYWELNEFSGQYLEYWEAFLYDKSEHHTVWECVQPNYRLKCARLLGTSLGKVGSWKEARRLEPTDG